MKHTKFKVVFVTGIESIQYTFGYTDAVILASAEMIKVGNDRTVDYVINLDTNKIVKEATTL